jgi:hypothetical protein
MAQLTYDPTPADNPEFSEEEQDSLRVGEELAEQQEQMLAGKFKSAEELEKAYVELQAKLGEPNDQETEQEEKETELQDEEVEVSSGAQLINNSYAEFDEKGELSEETMTKFSEMSSKDLVEAYIESMKNAPQQEAVQADDLTDAQINTIKNDAGGEAEYERMMQWAGENLDPEYVRAFDSVCENGNFQAIQIAVAGMKSAYVEANGYEGRMLTGKGAPNTGGNVFRSQAEVVAAMGDPRYDADPAYRQDVFEKLERSNIQF